MLNHRNKILFNGVNVESETDNYDDQTFSSHIKNVPDMKILKYRSFTMDEDLWILWSYRSFLRCLSDSWNDKWTGWSEEGDLAGPHINDYLLREVPCVHHGTI